jgi:hypothetical protein
MHLLLLLLLRRRRAVQGFMLLLLLHLLVMLLLLLLLMLLMLLMLLHALLVVGGVGVVDVVAGSRLVVAVCIRHLLLLPVIGRHGQRGVARDRQVSQLVGDVGSEDLREHLHHLLIAVS